MMEKILKIFTKFQITTFLLTLTILVTGGALLPNCKALSASDGIDVGWTIYPGLPDPPTYTITIVDDYYAEIDGSTIPDGEIHLTISSLNGYLVNVIIDADGSGNWSYTAGLLNAGTYDTSAYVTDEFDQDSSATTDSFDIVLLKPDLSATVDDDDATLSGNDAFPSGQMYVTLTHESGSTTQYFTSVDLNRFWTLVALDLDSGTYTAVGYTTDNNGVQSPDSDPVTFEIEKKEEKELGKPKLTSLEYTAGQDVRVNWDDRSQGEDGFQIYRRRSGGGGWTKVGEVGKNVETFLDEDVVAGETYTYRVRAFKGSKTSAYSNQLSITLPEEEAPPFVVEEEEEEVEPPIVEEPVEEPIIPGVIEEEEEEEEVGAVQEFIDNLIAGLGTDAVQNSMLAYAVATLVLFYFSILSFLPQIKDFALILRSLWDKLVLLAIPGKRKREEEPGIVYDSITGAPVNLAVVSIFDERGKKLDSWITDNVGSYGFLVPAGKFTLKVQVKGYEMITSEENLGNTVYRKNYLGGVIETTEDDFINHNIPMRALEGVQEEGVSTSKILFKKKSKAFVTFLLSAIFYIGFVASWVILYLSPTWFNALVVFIYLISLVIQETMAKKKKWGVVAVKGGGLAPFALIKIYRMVDGELYLRTVADEHGRYFLVLVKGDYRVEVIGVKGEKWDSRLSIKKRTIFRKKIKLVK